jgi:hypothetical protein
MPATTARRSGPFRPDPPRGRGRDQRARPIAVFCGCLLAASLSAPTQARASAVAEAQDLFGQGRNLRLHGDCASAVPLFHRAFDIYPAGLGSLRNVAECEESLGHFASARQAWLDLGRALVANHDPKYDGWVLDAEQGVERLPVAESVSGNAAGGDAKKEVAPAVATTTPLAAPASAAHEAPRPAATRTAGWVAIAVGGASLVGAGIALLVRQEDVHDLPGCAASRCPESMRTTIQPILDSGRTASALVDALGALGLVGVATGVVLLSVGHPRSPDAALVVSPTGLFAAGRF